MLRQAIIPAAIAAGAGAGCTDLIHIEAQASEVCLTGVRLDVPGADVPDDLEPRSDDEAPKTLELSHELEDPAAELPAELDASAELTGVAITAVEGIPNFGFIERVRIDIAAEGLEPLTVAEVGEEDSKMLERVDSWFITAEDDIELMDYLLASELAFDVVLEGEVPEADWAIELDVCVAGSAVYAPSALTGA